ncbi:ABC transporter permease [Pelagibius litoralis]|uniref:ABC transporter permease n=1 Tax=Pelagibius litoralis TaxID=374515 RepID=A0A967EVH3_9PROT|nr:ABC transporter permease [Pelagibius litoralis]NIA68507.1 ABC transporter permease [Pelagibius litoralis]
MKLFRVLVVAAGLLLLWEALVRLTAVPPFILPGPLAVALRFLAQFDLLLHHGWVTAVEILLGLFCGTLMGMASALLIVASRPARAWLMPLLVISQALPVFALAPLLTLWFGYGLASKVVMASLIIYFPVAAAFVDGLRRADPGLIDLARVMGASPLAILLNLRLPGALPALASGLRVAAATAPIGAVVGEWVGSSRGLGYLMLHANARLQVDLMFAALALLALFSLTLYFTLDAALRRLTAWQPESDSVSAAGFSLLPEKGPS